MAGSRIDRTAPTVGAVIVAVAGFLLLAMRQSFTVPFTGLGLAPAQLILTLAATAWVATRLAGLRAPAGLGVLSGVIVVRVAALLVSYGLAQRHPLNAGQRLGADRAMLTEVVAAILVVVVVVLLRRREDIELVLRAVVTGAAVSASFALVQYATGVDIAGRLRPPGFAEQNSVLQTALLREGFVRPQGAAAHPLELGAIAAIIVPLGIAVTLAARSRGARAWPWAVATLLVGAGGVVSLSRSTFLGIAVALVIMIPRWQLRRVGALAALLTTVVLVAMITSAKLVTALRTLFVQGSGDYSLQSRADGRSYVWAHFADHFWFGQGPGTYDLDHQPILDNQYLSQLMEGGTIGLLMMLGLLVCAFGYAVRAGSRRVRGARGELGSGVAGALGAVLVISFVLDTAGFAQVFTLIWLLIGMAGALWRIETGGVRPDERVTPRAVPVR